MGDRDKRLLGCRVRLLDAPAGILFNGALMSASRTDPSAPQFSLRAEARDGATVVECAGWLTAEFTGKFKSEIKSLIPGARRIVLDLAPLTYMDSSGIGAVAGAYVSARTAGCELRVAGMSRHVRELLKITHLLSVLGDTSPFPVKST
jgi:anti-sigma B factor antagonist